MRPGTLIRWKALKNIFKTELYGNYILLDLGGNDGSISRKIKKSFFPQLRSILVDLDWEGIKKAQKEGEKAVKASALNLPFRDKTFDAVICLDLIEHIQEDDQLINELSRVLKINGKLILTTPFKEGVTFPFYDKAKAVMVNKSWGHCRLGYSASELIDKLNSRNIKVKRADSYFNLTSRFFYRFLFLSNVRWPKKTVIWQFVIMAESYVRIGSQCHIVVGERR